MTENEFISKLTEELMKNKTTDAGDIIGEYEQHFAFKLADGYSENEIAARLGDPSELAAQYESNDGYAYGGGKKAFAVIGMAFAELFAGILFVLLAAWEIVMAAFSLICTLLAVCLLGGMNIYSLLPAMPYWCGAIFGLSLVALSMLAAAGSIYYAAFLRQLTRIFGRFRHNVFAVASGRPPLPSVAVIPLLPPKTNRRLRRVAQLSLAAFAVCFALAYISCTLSAGAVEFWHTWCWFGYTGV